MTTLPNLPRTIAVAGATCITVAEDRKSATIHRIDAKDVYAVVTSAEEAETVLTRGVVEHELLLGPPMHHASIINGMVAAVKHALQ